AARRDNPNEVTKDQIGLGNLENLSIAAGSAVTDGPVTQNAYVTPQNFLQRTDSKHFGMFAEVELAMEDLTAAIKLVAQVNGASFGIELYVAVGNEGWCYESADGLSWTTRSLPGITALDQLNAVNYLNGALFVMGPAGKYAMT